MMPKIRHKKKGTLTSLIEMLNVKEKCNGLNEGSLIEKKQIGFTSKGDLIVKKYKSEIYFDLTNDKETEIGNIDPNYKISKKTYEIFNNKEKLYDYYPSIFENSPIENFTINFKDLLEVAKNEKEWKEQENLQQN